MARGVSLTMMLRRRTWAIREASERSKKTAKRSNAGGASTPTVVKGRK